MAIWQECDRCGATTKDAGPEPWSTCTLSVAKAKKADTYDLCPRCYRDAKALLARPHTLTADQENLLAQIWVNAQQFDQSVGDFGRA